MKYPQLASEKKCTGCLACLDACTKSAISLLHGADGHIYVDIDRDKCVGCLRCERICSDIHEGKYGNNDKTSKPFAIYTKEERFYKNATSGGIFPVLAAHFLQNDGVVYGAAYKDGIHVVHKRISELDEIVTLQGSKYEQSDLSGTYKSIAKDLKENLRVLFVGTGCQIAGVLAYFKNNPKRELLFTVDLVCGGVPSSLLIESFAKNTADFKSVASYRKKEQYIFSYNSTNGKVVTCRKALPLDGFKSCLTNRYSCYDCEFTGLHRMSDWTIGDLWGDISGIARSLCLCHSDRGKNMMVNLPNIDVQEIDGWDFVCHNPRIVNGKASFSKRLERKYIGFIFRSFPYSIIKKIYGSDIKKSDVFWFLYKVYKFIRFKRYFAYSKNVALRISKS